MYFNYSIQMFFDIEYRNVFNNNIEINIFLTIK